MIVKLKTGKSEIKEAEQRYRDAYMKVQDAMAEFNAASAALDAIRQKYGCDFKTVKHTITR